jgi:hypothetical protein
MFIEMEKIEEFLGLLSAEDSKDIPVFLKEVKTVGQTGIISGAVVMQYQYDTDMVVVYREIIDSAVLPQVANINDEAIMKSITDYANKISKEFTDKLNAEKEKAVKVLNELGFKNIIPSVWG